LLFSKSSILATRDRSILSAITDTFAKKTIYDNSIDSKKLSNQCFKNLVNQAQFSINIADFIAKQQRIIAIIVQQVLIAQQQQQLLLSQSSQSSPKLSKSAGKLNNSNK